MKTASLTQWSRVEASFELSRGLHGFAILGGRTKKKVHDKEDPTRWGGLGGGVIDSWHNRCLSVSVQLQITMHLVGTTTTYASCHQLKRITKSQSGGGGVKDASVSVNGLRGDCRKRLPLRRWPAQPPVGGTRKQCDHHRGSSLSLVTGYHPQSRGVGSRIPFTPQACDWRTRQRLLDKGCLPITQPFRCTVRPQPTCWTIKEHASTLQSKQRGSAILRIDPLRRPRNASNAQHSATREVPYQFRETLDKRKTLSVQTQETAQRARYNMLATHRAAVALCDLRVPRAPSRCIKTANSELAHFSRSRDFSPFPETTKVRVKGAHEVRAHGTLSWPEDTIEGKVLHGNSHLWWGRFTTALQFGTQIYSYASKQWRHPQRKQRWTRNGKNWRKFRRGTTQKSETNLTWLMMQEKKGIKVHFVSLMDVCHLKNAELETKHQ